MREPSKKQLLEKIKLNLDGVRSFARNFERYAQNPNERVVGTSPEEQDARRRHKDWQATKQQRPSESVEVNEIFGMGRPRVDHWEGHFANGKMKGLGITSTGNSAAKRVHREVHRELDKAHSDPRHPYHKEVNALGKFLAASGSKRKAEDHGFNHTRNPVDRDFLRQGQASNHAHSGVDAVDHIIDRAIFGKKR